MDKGTLLFHAQNTGEWTTNLAYVKEKKKKAQKLVERYTFY